MAQKGGNRKGKRQEKVGGGAENYDPRYEVELPSAFRGTEWTAMWGLTDVQLTMYLQKVGYEVNYSQIRELDNRKVPYLLTKTVAGKKVMVPAPGVLIMYTGKTDRLVRPDIRTPAFLKPNRTYDDIALRPKKNSHVGLLRWTRSTGQVHSYDGLHDEYSTTYKKETEKWKHCLGHHIVPYLRKLVGVTEIPISLTNVVQKGKGELFVLNGCALLPLFVLTYSVGCSKFDEPDHYARIMKTFLKKVDDYVGGLKSPAWLLKYRNTWWCDRPVWTQEDETVLCQLMQAKDETTTYVAQTISDEEWVHMEMILKAENSEMLRLWNDEVGSDESSECPP